LAQSAVNAVSDETRDSAKWFKPSHRAKTRRGEIVQEKQVPIDR
jgi:hypothetical protein